MTEVTSSSSTSSDVAKSDDSSRKPGKLSNMLSMFEKKAEEKQQPPLVTRSASNSLTTVSSSSSVITPLQHSASTSSASSPAAPRVGASIADRMAAMKGLTMAAPSPPTASSHALPGKLSASAKTLPLSFEPPAAHSSTPSSASSSQATGSSAPRPNKLAIGGLGALNAALANGLKAGFTPGGVRSPNASITKREESDTKRAVESRKDEQKEDALLQTAPAALPSSSDDSAADGGGAAAELTHAKRAKRAGRTKAVSRPAAGTLKFKQFSDVSKAADMKAAVTIIGGEENKEQPEEAQIDKASDEQAAAGAKEQPVEHHATDAAAAATASSTTAPSHSDTGAVVSAASAAASTASTASAAAIEAVHSAPAHIAAAKPATGGTETPVLPANETKPAPSSAPSSVPATCAVVRPASPSPLDSSSASIDSSDSLDSSFSSVPTAASLDSSFSVGSEQLSVYNAAADYFQDATTLGYNPALHAAYSTLLHTGATFHRWQATGSSAKRLLYLSDCSTYLCLVDSKKRLPLDKVERKRRLPTQLLHDVLKGKTAGDDVWARAACKELLAGRCMLLRCAGEVGDGMLAVMHVEALTGVQRDEWEEALRWLVATKRQQAGSEQASA